VFCLSNLRIIVTSDMQKSYFTNLTCIHSGIFNMFLMYTSQEDSFPCSVQLNPFTREIVTAAGRSLRTWLAGSGEIGESYEGIANSDLTAVCMDPSGKCRM
jgi:hypothetical protein